MEDAYSSTTNMGEERGLGKSVKSAACVWLPRVSDFKDAQRTMNVDSSSNKNLEINCAPIYDDLVSKAWPSIFDDFESPVDVGVGGRDKGCLLFPVAFEPPLLPPPILSSPPKNVDFSQRDLSFEGDPNNPFNKKIDRPPPRPLEPVRFRKRICSPSYRTYVSSIAKQALTYFNSKQNVDFHLNEFCDFGINHGPKSTIHLNFIAESIKYEQPKLLYAEAKICYVDGKIEDEVKIKGCSMLMQTDRGNHLGFRCLICGDKVIHPGPRDGYTIIMGDRFKKSTPSVSVICLHFCQIPLTKKSNCKQFTGTGGVVFGDVV